MGRVSDESCVIGILEGGRNLEDWPKSNCPGDSFRPASSGRKSDGQRYNGNGKYEKSVKIRQKVPEKVKNQQCQSLGAVGKESFALLFLGDRHPWAARIDLFTVT